MLHIQKIFKYSRIYNKKNHKQNKPKLNDLHLIIY